jgi:hypothetical protein
VGENFKQEDVRFRHRIRPRYNRFLVPALIISLVIAVILILIVHKYLFKPAFEEKDSLRPETSVVAENRAASSQNLGVKTIL